MKEAIGFPGMSNYSACSLGISITSGPNRRALSHTCQYWCRLFFGFKELAD